jgi:anti-sigma regulatory factor (Ser/Thr protein kinase)
VHSGGEAQAIIYPSRSVTSVIPGVRNSSKMTTERRPLRRVFRGETSQVPLVRDFIRRYLDGWPCPAATVEDILLCASELAANAVCHSRSGLPGGNLTVQVVVRPGEWVEVAVGDAGGPWVTRDAGDNAECGRGLQIVSALSTQTGIVAGGHSRTVWFRCPWNPHADS